MKKIAVVNFANNRGWYQRGQQRLINAMKTLHPEIDVITFTDESQIPSPRHSDNPYAFKVYGTEKVRNMGYDVILWMDSSVNPVKNLKPILDYVEEHGYLMEYGGHLCSTWCNDKTLNFFGVTRDEAEKMEMFSACFMAMDFTKPIVQEFFKRWKSACEAGCFVGSWNNDLKTESMDARCRGHRHDQSASSIIMAQLGMKQTRCGTYMAYIGDTYGEPAESVCLYAHPC